MWRAMQGARRPVFLKRSALAAPTRKTPEARARAGVIDGEEGGAAEDGGPASPFAVEGAVEEAAEEILLGEGGEGDRHDGVGDAQAVEFGHRFVGFSEEFGSGGEVVEGCHVAVGEEAEEEASAGTEKEWGEESADLRCGGRVDTVRDPRGGACGGFPGSNFVEPLGKLRVVRASESGRSCWYG